METLAINLFGFWLNNLTFNPVVDVPIFTLIVFAVSAAVIYPLKKIPYVKKIIG
jgi:hypothetical protein